VRLLLLGCSGFIGRELVPHLLERGHTITLVSRHPSPPASAGSSLAGQAGLDWLVLDPSTEEAWADPRLRAALAAADGVVNLAGEPIAERRWSPAHLQLLVDSRVRTTQLLVEALRSSVPAPGVLISGSAIGFYGTDLSARFSEASPAGDDVLGRLCVDWEAAATAADTVTRVVIVRTGIVLGPDGGALGRMLPVFRSGFGGPIGSGQQWMSWIHRRDLCRLVGQALGDSTYAGAINAVAPEPVRMVAFSNALGAALHRPSLLPVPGPVLQLLLGDGAKVVLEGQQVVSERLSGLGFEFDYGDLKAALAAATSPESR